MLEWLIIGCRWVLGLQLLFWGLNGFFQWKAIPACGAFIDRFSDICAQSKFIMPTVKTIEIVFGIALLTGYATLLSLIFLGPIIFVISGLHLLHNRRWWQVLIPITVPYLLLVLAEQGQFRSLLH